MGTTEKGFQCVQYLLYIHLLTFLCEVVTCDKFSYIFFFHQNSTLTSSYNFYLNLFHLEKVNGK